MAGGSKAPGFVITEAGVRALAERAGQDPDRAVALWEADGGKVAAHAVLTESGASDAEARKALDGHRPRKRARRKPKVTQSTTAGRTVP